MIYEDMYVNRPVLHDVRILSVVTKEGSILHEKPHQGNAVERFPNVLLRGDLY